MPAQGLRAGLSDFCEGWHGNIFCVEKQTHVAIFQLALYNICAIASELIQSVSDFCEGWHGNIFCVEKKHVSTFQLALYDICAITSELIQFVQTKGGRRTIQQLWQYLSQNFQFEAPTYGDDKPSLFVSQDS